MHIGGRALLQSGSIQTQWPGAYFDAAFRGSTVFLRIGPNHEILHIVVDHGSPLSLQAPHPGTWRLSGLPNTAHTVRVLVATESQAAPNSFGGLAVPPGETALPAPAASARQIEFIGDSHTVGYGNASPTTRCTSDEIWATTDNTRSFAALVSARFHADYQVNAISGRGIVRNYNNSPGDTLPAAYPYTLFNNRRFLAKDATWHPQLMVISLGTNDFSTTLKSNEPWKTRNELHDDFERTFVRFLTDLRRRYPDSWIVLWTTDLENGEIEAEVRRVVDEARAQGLQRLDLIPFHQLTFSACDGHPSLTDDQTIARGLSVWIDAHPQLNGRTQ